MLIIFNGRKLFLKAKIGITLLVFILLGVTFKFIIDQNGVDQTYLLPNGFEGCVMINYGVEGASPLRIKNDEIFYKVPESGIIDTSSSYNFGWANEEFTL